MFVPSRTAEIKAGQVKGVRQVSEVEVEVILDTGAPEPETVRFRPGDKAAEIYLVAYRKE